MIREPLALAALIAALTALAFWLDRRFAWGKRLGATLLVILFGALVSNLGLVPVSSPVYDAIMGPVTSLAIAWLLLAVDLRDLRAAGPRMLGAFAIAMAATATGAVAATLLFADAFGGDAWKLAGVMTGTYSGGSLNFVAVGRALELPSTLFAAATAADNVVTALWIGATLMLPVWLARYYPAPPAAAPEPSAAGAGPVRARDGGSAEHPFFAAVPLRLLDLSLLLAIGFVLLWAASAIAGAVPAVPEVLWLTTLALAAGQLPPVRRLAGALQLGSLALHFFFAVIGIGSRVAEIARVGPEVFYLTALVVLIHGAITFGGARLARLDAGTAAVASQAAVGGPSTALALAVARDWRVLVLPGTVVGLLGYALGNYAGLAVAYLVRGMLGG